MKLLTATALISMTLAGTQPALAHTNGTPNFQPIAWERSNTTPDGVKWATFVDISSISRAGDIVSFKEAWSYMNEKNEPVVRIGSGWVVKDPTTLKSNIRVHDCRDSEYLQGSTYRDSQGKLEVKQLTTWAPVPAGNFRTVHSYVCGQ